MKRWSFFLYGVGSHLLFLATFAYMAGFVGNLPVPKTIDSTSEGTTGTAIAIDLLLLGLFAAQHSIMARPAFKQLWTQVVPQPIERSTYVMIANLLTILLMWQWRGINTVVWDVQQPVLRAAMWSLFAFGWLLVPSVTLMIDHFDLFGTRQVWLHLRSRNYEPLPFQVAWFYKHVRHPLYIGWAIAFWATPTMTVGHLLFAGVLTGYMALAALVEERDLIAHFGHQYDHYRRRVPMFIPRLSASDVKSSQGTLDSKSAVRCEEQKVGHV
jgi:protein-S-isoprenylcysteine O-methyltransferase Ste14